MNRLGREKSPYLIQHKDNPVDWYPWSDEAFEQAQKQDKPVFLSIGYATCHWCHVMEAESFEDEDVARLMNDAFVNIKVDREERPDVDQIYMTVCQMATGHGGWPLSVILTPDRKPFYVETYIPKHGRPGRAGMMELVPAIRDAWSERRREVLESADSLTDALSRAVEIPTSDEYPGAMLLSEAFSALGSRYDPTHGGFGSAPKFPSPHNLLFLLRYASRAGDDDALEMVRHTLLRMRSGGIFDQIGFGFHRYSTDQRWLLPHFEKMLYDQALMLMAYTEAWHSMGNDTFRRAAYDIIEYVSDSLTAPSGAFYSAEDADTEGEEGMHYVWMTAEVKEVLSESDGAFVIERFNLLDEGNFDDEATRVRTGANVLWADKLDAWEETDLERWALIRRTLLTHRKKRVRPLLDDKILTDWNGLMIAALASAGRVFGDAGLVARATRAAGFIFESLDVDGDLLHRYRDGDAAIDANLDDYAFMIWASLELYHASFDIAWLEKAIDLQNRQSVGFGDPDDGGYFFAPESSRDLLVRQKEFGDGATPSGNSISLLNLFRLYRMTGDTGYEDEASALIRQASVLLDKMPASLTGLLMGFDFWLGPSQEIVYTSGSGEAEMAEVLRKAYLPRTVVLRRSDADADRLQAVAPFTGEQHAIDGKATAYVCVNFACHAPVTTVAELQTELFADKP